MTDMPRTINKLLPITAKNLLKELSARITTIIEFNIECAKWSMSSINKYAYTPAPEPPFEVIHYAKRKVTDQNYSLTVDFWNQPAIKQWRADDARVLGLNRGNYDWLQFLNKSIKSPDIKLRVNELIRDFDKRQWWIFGKDVIKSISEYDLHLPSRSTRV